MTPNETERPSHFAKSRATFISAASYPDHDAKAMGESSVRTEGSDSLAATLALALMTQSSEAQGFYQPGIGGVTGGGGLVHAGVYSNYTTLGQIASAPLESVRFPSHLRTLYTRPPSPGLTCLTMKSIQAVALVSIGLLFNGAAFAAPPSFPVKEVTVFKDGHAFVVHEGKLPTDNGNVTLDYLPTPVIGTFWTYSADPATPISRVVAGQRRTVIERTALTLREMIEGNTGAEVSVTETNGTSYPATLLGFPTRSSEELRTTSPPLAPERLAEKSQLVLLKLADGTKVVPLERIQDLVFKQLPKTKSGQEEFRSSLTLRFDWGKRQPTASAGVGLVYLQKGIRWIPSYKIDLDGKGRAKISLQATVLNELIDLEDATLQLVIGMPSFYFKDTVDPIALQQTAAELSQFFQTDAGRNRASLLARNFDNALMSQMTQVRRAGDSQGNEPAETSAPGQNMTDGGKHEDLYIFSVPRFTLKKGERAILSLAEYSVPYTDVFTLDLPYAPPADLRQHFGSEQQAELLKMLSNPTVVHKARLQNSSPYPFTTAPALLFREGRVLAQSIMTYAGAGASTDVKVTSALDISVKKTDRETKRTPNAYSQGGNSYLRVDLAGQIRLTNRRAQPVEVEVVRHALGHIDTTDHNGAVEMNNIFEGGHLAGNGSELPEWWNWYNWPWWWHQVNGVGRVTWKLRLEPGKPLELGYTWHYHRQ
jgi:hypothetical protein